MASEQPRSGPDGRHWQEWHAAYADPGSPMSARLATVQARLREALDRVAAGPVRLLSACAGQGRDVVGALSGQPRAADVRGVLVELDPVLAGQATRLLHAAGLEGIEVRITDAGLADAYVGAVPADLVLLCGIFGNVSEADIETTVRCSDQLCAHGATLVWTRHRRAPDLTSTIRAWFAVAGFTELAFDAPPDALFSVGTCRFDGVPAPLQPGVRLFTFTD